MIRFLNNGAITQLIGAHRMTETMLTGRRYGVTLGLAPNAVVRAIARIIDMSHSDGLFTKAPIVCLSQTTPDPTAGLNALLEKRAPHFK